MERLQNILRTVWGYDQFRPLQAEAMQCVLENRDSVVVMPTGGGKSLCFQAPALALPGLAVVVSPLISLMKDQVDALAESGVPAACINSSLSPVERQSVAEEIRAGRLKLLYLSPEKLMTERTLRFLQQTPLAYFAIDEAHCISDWGHDFRPEYRMLRQLKQTFPQVGVHAYTATATETVRSDIARELQLSEPQTLVGSFDRPNLIYRAERRTELLDQIRQVIDRHPGDSGIIYCIRRKDADSLAASLCHAGLAALPYHAGLDDVARRRNQDDFINDRARIIVATVAFGMGIDKSDVRYVIHAGAPKSLEAYQQESGRAGRDGLEADCCLFYGGGDFQTWRRLQCELSPPAYAIAMQVLAGIENYCTAAQCRHRAISEYFGQSLAAENCQACDVCLGEIALVDDPLLIAQKILSCVLRVKESFGGEYVAQILTGSRDQRILENGHENLSTWNLLGDHRKRSVRNWIEQLVAQAFLEKTGEYNVLTVTTAGRRLLRGEVAPRLLRPAERKRDAKISTVSWEGVDRGLFEVLRALRRQTAQERKVPPFVVFSDATLRELARWRPTTSQGLLRIQGIGQHKAAEYGEAFLTAILDYGRERQIPLDMPAASPEPPHPSRPSADATASGARRRALALFLEGKSIDEVSRAVGRARSTASEYLTDLIASEGICDPAPWIESETFERIRVVAESHGIDRLKPLFEALGGSIPYDQLRIAVACLRNLGPY